MPKKFHLGHFIQLHHVEKAIELLTHQLSQKSPLYNNLDFTIYRADDLRSIDTVSYYDEYIKRDGLYYFEDLFFSKKYFSIQRAYKIREFHFLSLHSMILYYALGFYIQELLNIRIARNEELHSARNIDVFYGGKINFENPRNSRIFYYEDYKDFLRLKEDLTTPREGKTKYAISLDIKSFFYTISHNILIKVIDELATPTLKNLLNYDSDTKDAILMLLKYFQGYNIGLPVSNQNIFSSFLSSIYFSKFDQFVIDKYLTASKYHYIRYVDDFYLIFEEGSEVGVKEIRQQIYKIENEFAEYLMKTLDLSVSPSKCERYVITDTQSQIEFLKSSNIDSPFDQEFDVEDLYQDSVLSLELQGKPIPVIFKECIEILKELRKQTYLLPQLYLEVKESAFLNFILILKKCLLYSKSPDAINVVRESGIFSGLDDIDYLLIKPKVLFHLITITKESRLELLRFILENLVSEGNTYQKLTLVDKFIHQMMFLIADSKGKEIELLTTEWVDYRNLLVSNLEKMKQAGDDNSYLELLLKALLPEKRLVVYTAIYTPEYLNREDTIAFTQQIKLRRISEISLNYNVCFNHLLNEFQNLFELVYFGSSQKTAPEIRKKMVTEGFTSSQINFIADFFERRNQNSISHTNNNVIGVWGVGQTEYLEYKQKMEPIMQILFSRIPSIV